MGMQVELRVSLFDEGIRTHHSAPSWHALLHRVHPCTFEGIVSVDAQEVDIADAEGRSAPYVTDQSTADVDRKIATNPSWS